jgi:hypothetical protein
MQFDRLKRREVITLLGGAAAAWPLAAGAQQPNQIARIGYLSQESAAFDRSHGDSAAFRDARAISAMSRVGTCTSSFVMPTQTWIGFSHLRPSLSV